MPTLLNNCTAKKTISVKIRIKPSQSSSDVPYSSTQITVNNRTYNFQHIFPPTASQPQLFEHIVPLLDSFIAGFNTTVVVYGQTGSGKTYTMGTTPEQMVYNYEGDSYSGENNTPYVTKGEDNTPLSINIRNNTHYINNSENNTPCISTGNNNTPLSIGTQNNTFLNDNTVTNTPIITTTNTNTHIITTPNTNTSLSNTSNTNTPLSTTPYTNTPIITTPYNNTTLTNTLGILPRSVIYLFNNINVPIILSFIEIYNEEVYDLLSDNKVPLIIRENNGIPILTGVSKHTIYSTKCAFKKLNKGLLERKTKSTKMNLNSSRSHAIITLQVKDTLLTFVDLAGSERMERSGVKGEKVKECICINSGLLSLSNVINSMYKKNKHIPFRDSKLTRLLQPSFIGQCYTLVVGCISLEGVDMGEGVNTLVYCYRICCIEGYIVRRMGASLDYKEEVLKVRKENENLIGEIRKLEGVIDMLKRENEKLRRGVSDSKSRLEGVSSKNMLEAVNYSTNIQQGANYSTNEQQGVNISTNKQQGVSNSIYGYKGVENKDLLNNKVFTPSKIIKGLNIGNTTINNKKEYLHDRLGGVNRSVIGDSRLRGVNKSVVGSGLRGVNKSAVECGLRGVNRSVINDRLTGVNKSVINDKLTGVNRSVINDKLTGVNRSVINNKLTGVNKSVINDKLTGVNKSVVETRLTGVNKGTNISSRLTGVNRSVIDGIESKGVNNVTNMSSRLTGVSKESDKQENSSVNTPVVTRGIFNTSSNANYQRLLKDRLVNNKTPLSQDNKSNVVCTPLSQDNKNTVVNALLAQDNSTTVTNTPLLHTDNTNTNTPLLHTNKTNTNTPLLHTNNTNTSTPLLHTNNTNTNTPVTLKRKDSNQPDSKKIKDDKRRVTFKINTTLTPVKYKKKFKVINTLLYNKRPVTGISAYKGVIYTCSLNNTITAYSINKGGVISSYEDKEGLSNLSVINGCYLYNSSSSLNNTPLLQDIDTSNNTPLFSNSPVNNTPITTNTSLLNNTPIITNTSLLNNTPISTNTSLLNNTPLSYTIPFTDNMTVTDSNVLYYSNNNFKVIDMKYNKEVLKIRTSSTITSMKTKGCYIIGGHENGNISIFDSRMYNKPLYYKNIHKSTIFSIDLYKSNIFSGSRDHTIGVFDFNLNNTLLLNPPHYDSVMCVLVYKDSLISGSRDCSLKRWSIEDKSVVKTYPYAHESWVKSLCLSDGFFVSGGKDCKIKGWGFNDKSLVSLGECSVKGGVNCIVEDEGVLFVGSQDKSVYVIGG
ncbi:hypothetical protein LUQ84_003033 [Hamiltosporidium tvaerminnensis]|nr:hypothetical protein LUQ84_003033 [Hamiltosporidium tvaerminnensis]